MSQRNIAIAVMALLIFGSSIMAIGGGVATYHVFFVDGVDWIGTIVGAIILLLGVFFVQDVIRKMKKTGKSKNS